MVSLPAVTHNVHFTDFQDRLEADWLEDRFTVILDSIEGAASAAAAIAAMEEFNELARHVRTHVVRANLNFRLHSNDEEIIAENRRQAQTITPVLSAARRRLSAAVSSSRFRTAFEERFGSHWFAKLDLQATSGSAESAPIQGRVEDLIMQYTSTVASATFAYGDTDVPLSHARRAAVDPDQTARRDAFHSYAEWWEATSPDLQDCFDGILAARQDIGRVLGTPGYAPVRYADLGRLDWGPDDAARFRASVLEHLMPLATRIRRAQAGALGSVRVHPGDAGYFPQASVGSLKIPLEDELAAASRTFHRLSPELGTLLDRTVRDGRADVLTRAGKAPGAYVATFHDQGLPFVYLNNVGIGRDVKTLVHEFGHAFQTYLSAPIELVDLRKPTLEACEVHSMSLEMLTLPYVDEFLATDDIERYRRDLLWQGVLASGHMAAIDAFQHELYREDGTWPDRSERGDIWRRLADDFMPGIDHDAMPWWSANRWLTVRHVFLFPFYFLDYALAQVVAWQFLDLAEADQEQAMETYFSICRAGGTAPFTTLLADAGLGSPFDPDVVAQVAESLERRLDVDSQPR